MSGIKEEYTKMFLEDGRISIHKEIIAKLKIDGGSRIREKEKKVYLS